uniref:Uncharacterized protein n=2 Tax=Oryza sativa subsp. japonica TaxID=39947 RepID=Q53KY3_ORYSJ|nr:hypothetical protein LOC_Os11g25600 [Oryza sativa Japonica Group]ABA93369.1 hypothetical protein LOC_Os11g25600 [Oryza sativa Japonica Group]
MWPHMSSSLLFHSFFLFCFYNYMLSSHCRERRASGEGRRERHEGGGEIVGPADVGGAAALSSRREGGKGAAVHGVGVRRKGRRGVTPRGDWWERAARRPAGEDQRRTLARRVGGRGTAAHAVPPERSTNRSAAKPLKWPVWKNRFSRTGLLRGQYAKMRSFSLAAHLSDRMEKSIFPYGPLKEPYAKIKFEKFKTSLSHSYEL